MFIFLEQKCHSFSSEAGVNNSCYAFFVSCEVCSLLHFCFCFIFESLFGEKTVQR